MLPRLGGLGLLLALIGLAGCGNADNMADVAGAVTFDGQPVNEGNITFVPVDGKSPTAGGVIKEGRYQARVPIGRMKVAISAPRVVGTKKIYDTPDSPVMPITVEALPARYSDREKTEIEINVQPGGNNDENFELTSK